MIRAQGSGIRDDTLHIVRHDGYAAVARHGLRGTPAHVKTRVPIILLLNFGGGAGRRDAAAGEPPNAAEMLARGWGYTTVGYNDIQPDRADAWHTGDTRPRPASGQRSWSSCRAIPHSCRQHSPVTDKWAVSHQRRTMKGRGEFRDIWEDF